MIGIVLALVFVLGLSIGSFLNVLVYRLAVEISPWRGRSKCPKCKQIISWYDNIPLLSFVMLRGECRRCGRKISWQYPLVELLTGLMFVGVWWWQTTLPYSAGFQFVGSIIYWLMIFSALVVVIIADMKYQLIYDEALWFGAIVWLLGLFWLLPQSVWLSAIQSGLWGAVFFAGTLRLIRWLSRWIWRRPAMGFGDVKLAGLLGLLVRWPQVILVLQLAFLTGAIAGVILLITGRKSMKGTMAFGPFLVIAAVAVILANRFLWLGYLNILNIN